MGQYYLHQQDQRQWLCYLCGSIEGYNRNLYTKLQNQQIEGLIPIQLKEEARGRIFIYDIGTKVSLFSVLQRGITEQRLLKLLLDIISQALDIKKLGFETENIMWSTQCIFVDERASKLGLIMDISTGEENRGNLRERIKSWLMDAKIYSAQFSVDRFILQYMDTSPDTSIEGLFNYMENLYHEFFECKEYSGHLSLTSRLDKKGIHIGDYVEIISDQEKNLGYLEEVCLIRARTKERIPIKKELFYIGKEASAVDYCIGDNAAVSRSHACIVTMNSRYYIRDLGSTNRTYVNNLEVSSNHMQELRPGYSITLANEVFYFQ